MNVNTATTSKPVRTKTMKRPTPISSERRTTTDVDVVALYMQDVGHYRRVGREEEIRISEQIFEAKTVLADLAGAAVRKGADTFGGSASPQKRRRGRCKPLARYLEAAREARACSQPTQAGDEAEANAQPALPGRHELSPAQVEAVIDKLQQAARSAVGRSAGRANAAAACFGLTRQELLETGKTIEQQRAVLATRREQMIAANLRLVVSLARSFKRYPVDPSDLIQEGNIALMRAVDAFDPRRGHAFATFACLVIRRAMNAFIMVNTRPVRVPKTTLELRRRIHAAQWELGAHVGEYVDPEEIADYLGLQRSAVIEALTSHEDSLSLDDDDEDRREASLANQLADPNATDPAEALAGHQQERWIAALVEDLDPRDRAILESRYGDDQGTTLAVAGKGLGVTRERTRQLESRALKRLRLRGSGRDPF